MSFGSVHVTGKGPFDSATASAGVLTTVKRDQLAREGKKFSDQDERAIADPDELQLPCCLECIDCLPDPRARDKMAEERFHFLLVGCDYTVQILG